MATEICAHNFSPEIFSDRDAKKDNSDSLYIGLIFPYTYFIDFSIPVGGITDV